jgi:hypothetical protein
MAWGGEGSWNLWLVETGRLEIAISTPRVVCNVSRLWISLCVDNLTGIAITPAIMNSVAPPNGACSVCVSKLSMLIPWEKRYSHIVYKTWVVCTLQQNLSKFMKWVCPFHMLIRHPSCANLKTINLQERVVLLSVLFCTCLSIALSNPWQQETQTPNVQHYAQDPTCDSRNRYLHHT